MSMVYHTVRVYGACARDAGAALGRSPLAVVFLVLAFVTQFFAALALAPLGMAGSFALGFLQALLVGWYLALVRHVLHQQRALTLAEVRDRAGALFRETISILFLFSIATLLLGMASPMLPLVAVPAAGLAFNAAPEVLYQGRSTGTEILGEAWEFLRQNWPEWLAVNGVAVAVATVLRAALTGGFDPWDVLVAAQLFGPWFGFLDLPSWGIAWLGLPVGLVPGLLLCVAAHAFMLFRGFLYRELASGSRRARAFRARASGSR